MSAQAPPEAAVEAVLAFADDELVLGWRDSEWTGIAPFLEEDVAFSSIAQGEIGHARALYELAAGILGGDADELAFDREPAAYRCAPFVELQLVGDWAATVARHWLYETADSIRVGALLESDWPELAGLAAKMDREEAYHRMHAQMWFDKLAGDERFENAVAELWPYALGVLEPEQRERLAELAGRELVTPAERGSHEDGFAALHEEMTMVRRSVPGAAW
ncbi:MAG: 1,2-phenylacetyl-CoA epoxidase subunit PaaC [Gaiellaceae bacterium]